VFTETVEQGCHVSLLIFKKLCEYVMADLFRHPKIKMIQGMPERVRHEN